MCGGWSVDFQKFPATLALEYLISICYILFIYYNHPLAALSNFSFLYCNLQKKTFSFFKVTIKDSPASNVYIMSSTKPNKSLISCREKPQSTGVLSKLQGDPKAQRHVTKPFDVWYLSLRRHNICLSFVTCCVVSWDAHEPKVIRWQLHIFQLHSPNPAYTEMISGTHKPPLAFFCSLWSSPHHSTCNCVTNTFGVLIQS